MFRATTALLMLTVAASVAAQPADAPAKAKPTTKRVCSVQAFTGGLIKKQKICRTIVDTPPTVAAAEPAAPPVPAAQ